MLDQHEQAEDKQTERREEPESNELAKKWKKRIEGARKDWGKFHKRVKHNRNTVAGFNWDKEADSEDFYQHRANLIHGTITAMLPSVYARNPEISAVPVYNGDQLKLFCKTIESVTNRQLEAAGLKNRAKSTVRSALTSSFGIVKVMYQRDLQTDPIIQSRMNDTQDNIREIERLISDLENEDHRSELEAKRSELEQLMASLSEQVEITAAEGLVIDRVLTENLLIDPSVCEFWDYPDADWMCQIIPMKRSQAEAQYSMKLSKAKAYGSKSDIEDGRLASGGAEVGEDKQIAVLEIWDKTTQRVYTMAEGCDYWLRDPYSPPKVGSRWYPFFLLPFQVVDGQFIGPSLVDLTEKLQVEHNEARDRFNEHRDLCKPGFMANEEVNEKSIKRYKDSEIGEITIIESGGKPINQAIMPRQHPPIDPAVYDTSAVRQDWEQVTGLQDAARSTVVKPKTATEANIMQQSLSGRVSEFRDQVEDWLQIIAQYAAQILLQEMTPPQIERIMGPGKQAQVSELGELIAPAEPSYEWPQLEKESIFEMVEMKIRAGTTGAPDKLEQQESWGKVLPTIQGLITQVIQLQAAGGDVGPLVNLMRETVKRFDERLDVEQFIPKTQPMMQLPQQIPPQI